MAFSVRGRVAAIPDRVLDARLIACLLQPMGCARLNDMCVHDGTMGQMLPSTDSAGRLWIVLPALLARFCGGAGVGSGAWVPA